MSIFFFLFGILLFLITTILIIVKNSGKRFIIMMITFFTFFAVTVIYFVVFPKDTYNLTNTHSIVDLITIFSFNYIYPILGFLLWIAIMWKSYKYSDLRKDVQFLRKKGLL